MKEDEVDRDKRRESAEKQKSVLDLKKKKEKKKNLDRQAPEVRRVKSRQRGNLRKSPLMRMRAMMATIATIRREWRPVSTGSSRVRLVPTPMPHKREHQKRDQVGLLRGSRGSRPLTAPVLTSLPRRLKVGPSRAPNLPLRQRRATGPSPSRWGR